MLKYNFKKFDLIYREVPKNTIIHIAQFVDQLKKPVDGNRAGTNFVALILFILILWFLRYVLLVVLIKTKL